MASWRTFRIHTFAIAGLSLAAALILATGPATADTQPGRSKFFMPWEAPTYQGYSETARPTQPPPAVITAAPQKYNLVVSQIPSEAVGVEPDRIQLMAHVPEDARVWIEDAPTTSTGVERVYKSPPLAPGKEYSYTIRVAWLEDGHWVSKDAVAQVKPGQCHCFYLERAGTPAEKDADIKANLAKLAPEDRKLADAVEKAAQHRDLAFRGRILLARRRERGDRAHPVDARVRLVGAHDQRDRKDAGEPHREEQPQSIRAVLHIRKSREAIGRRERARGWDLLPRRY